jgi:membrane-associated protease RseP (regulator of RpoE activity)
MDIPGMWKFGLSVIEMIIVSQIMIRHFNFDGEIGLVLLRSKKGLKMINDMSKNTELFKFLSDMGSTLSYGLLSVVFMRKNTSVKSVVTGMLLLFLISGLVAPSVVPFLSDVLDIESVNKAREAAAGDTSMLSIALLSLIIGGFFLVTLVSIVSYSFEILKALIDTIAAGTDAIAQTPPGGTLLLPGVNLPFFEGILALVVILAVHEGAHAILARVGKIPVLSSGIVLFGILPIGAFVEPDEKKLAKLEPVAQTRVLVAGSASNLMFSLIFFMLFVGFVLTLRSVDITGIPLAPQAAMFIQMVLGMTFTLNFIVGMVNLLPLPFFDGYRILDVNIKNKHIVKGLMIITLLAFLMNFLPWFFS